MAQVFCTWGTVETAELQLARGREYAVGEVVRAAVGEVQFAVGEVL